MSLLQNKKQNMSVLRLPEYLHIFQILTVCRRKAETEAISWCCLSNFNTSRRQISQPWKGMYTPPSSFPCFLNTPYLFCASPKAERAIAMSACGDASRYRNAIYKHVSFRRKFGCLRAHVRVSGVTENGIWCIHGLVL
jgi:hypothetical protein